MNGVLAKLDLNFRINPLNAELNPICHLLALIGGATIVVVSRLRVNNQRAASEVCSAGGTDTKHT